MCGAEGGAPLALVMFPGNCFKQFASKLTALNDSLIGIKRLANGSLRTYLIGAVVLREEWKSTLSLQGLKKCPRNYLQALKAIPRTLRMMTLYSDEPARVSLDGQLVNANEASSARAIKGGLNPEQAMAWELFSPIQRFLFVVVIVVVISVAIAESKKNRHIMKLKKSVELSVCGN
ncbi:PREDICTED: multisubstrate pseudouridine synthase 7 [Prunus dulcis]|uniref:PREDICTED: multisubstrate pseudouridine synthase 7 n=1 Tax=Prunus dulcis TaxID=3755 RepID=A0A5E4EQJ2_PRUDU|nr:PREDICTED: multisubstrate pseudouridine synthase 7 [Prunus dulcis]